MPISKQQLLAEADDLIRRFPSKLYEASAENAAWRGRAAAVVGMWNSIAGRTALSLALGEVDRGAAPTKVRALLHQMRYSLVLETGGSSSIAVADGAVFEYFDELTQKIGLAKHDIMFVDPYIDPEFVSRYLPQVTTGAKIRLLTKKRMAALLPAVELFANQHNTTIEVREASFHDRFVFVDSMGTLTNFGGDPAIGYAICPPTFAL